MESCAILSVLRNEGSKWLQSTLNAWASFADTIVALDDGSTDDTAAILQACPKVQYHSRDGLPMWGQEAGVRQQLWRLGVASGADWLFVLDADMLPASNPRKLMTRPADAVCFSLYDLWSLHPPLYRYDGAWQAHANYRVWAVRNPGSSFEDAWPTRGIHTGHFPMNLPVTRPVYATTECSLLHLAYSDAAARQQKAQQYAEASWQMSPAEQAHAASIADALVHAAPVPFAIEYDIVKAEV